MLGRMASFAHPTRAVARSTRGMIATPHAAASQAGVEILRNGGTAVDAAIAANAVLTVVYPASCGIGGDALWLVYEPRLRRAIAYNGSGRAPAGLCAGVIRDRGFTAMPERGALAVTVPGAVRSWEDVLRAHGRFDFETLLAPAHRYASDGFVVTDTLAAFFAANQALLDASDDARALFLARGVPRAGDRLRNEPLAATLRMLATKGADALYAGPIADAIVQTLNDLGNPMSATDLSLHRTQAVEPLRTPWRGREILAHPPNSQGALTPLVLRMLEADADAQEAQWLHRAIESFKLAFDLRNAEFGEPETMRIRVEDSLEPSAVSRLRSQIDPHSARVRIPPVDHGDTIAIVAVDEDGLAVSLIESLYRNFGSGIVASGTGIFLHNRGAYFTLQSNHPNELRAGKRPLHTLSPGMIMHNGVPEFVYGTMGGDGQTQTHVQIVHNLYERGMSVQQAIDAPRFVYGRDSETNFSDGVRIESRMPAETIEYLRQRGQSVQLVSAFESALGHAHGIFIDAERGTLAGGADPRADSAALGW